ncbi:hypothetical protein FD00_GL001098 [Liquorilactobacillus mali KCTC 3596 = DSM 20444]|uniref:Uncharacterized protein n=1 Tax=Liquorilactobacillus mali KCTC 3596 = DSM 20444 TaxID=1046596 RepID=A0A0R2DZK3_9LACO|nr:hypothetical protein FD00_GL001098 [Liquorilactobacillus mali KCTC 3596 = DSM 20444]
MAIAYILVKQYFSHTNKNKSKTRINVTDRNGNITQVNVNGETVNIESKKD